MEFKFDIVKTDTREFKIPISKPEIIEARFDVSDIVCIIEKFRKRGYTIVNEYKEHKDRSDYIFFYQYDIMSPDGFDFRLRFTAGTIKFFPRDEDKEAMQDAFDEFDEILGEQLSKENLNLKEK